jgi:hypothetical protein
MKSSKIRKGLGQESLLGSPANSAEQKTRLQREIEATDREIDQLVYSRGRFMPNQYEAAEFLI